MASGIAGLFQELIRPVLANSAATKPLHDLIYTYTGMKLQGAILIFVIGALATMLWTKFQPMDSSEYPAAVTKGWSSGPVASFGRLATAYVAKGNTEEARKTFTQIVEQHPGSPYASEARQEIENLKG